MIGDYLDCTGHTRRFRLQSYDGVIVSSLRRYVCAKALRHRS